MNTWYIMHHVIIRYQTTEYNIIIRLNVTNTTNKLVDIS